MSFRPQLVAGERSEPGPAHKRVKRKPITVVLAEGHATMRRGLRLLLDGEEDIDVVAEADELSAALSQVHGYHPRVLVLDLRMPSGSSIDAVRNLHAQSPRTGVVMITMHEGNAFARQAFEAGALGYVLKDSADSDLPDAIRHAAAGECYASPRVAAGGPA